MQIRQLGKSAIAVSALCVGAQTFGTQTPEKEALRILDQAFDAGVNFIDTSENYPIPPAEDTVGLSETIVGRWLKGKPRDAVIINTKVAGPSHGWLKAAQRSGMTALDRHNIVRAIDGSLRRLGTDYVDVYQTHWPDHAAPCDEILETFDSLMRAGKLRIFGCCNETSWGLMNSLAVSRTHRIARPHVIQNNFSLNNRRFEDDLADICRREGVSLLAYSPLAGGVLTNKYAGGAKPPGARFTLFSDLGGHQATMVKRYLSSKSLQAAERYAAIAADFGLSPVTMAIAWNKQHDFVASTVFGVSRADQLPAVLDAANLSLPADVVAAIDQVSLDIMYPLG